MVVAEASRATRIARKAGIAQAGRTLADRHRHALSAADGRPRGNRGIVIDWCRAARSRRAPHLLVSDE